MKYPVSLVRTEEGYSVSCPGLPGCWSQGDTEDEALANIRDAILEYLHVARELAGKETFTRGRGARLARGENSRRSSPPGSESPGEGWIPHRAASQAYRDDRRYSNHYHSKA